MSPIAPKSVLDGLRERPCPGCQVTERHSLGSQSARAALPPNPSAAVCWLHPRLRPQASHPPEVWLGVGRRQRRPDLHHAVPAGARWPGREPGGGAVGYAQRARVRDHRRGTGRARELGQRFNRQPQAQRRVLCEACPGAGCRYRRANGPDRTPAAHASGSITFRSSGTSTWRPRGPTKMAPDGSSWRGAVLHLQAEPKWLDICEEHFVKGGTP